jgi:hypothetical protein
MLFNMRLLLDSFWRALGYCLHPKVMLLSLMPLTIMVAAAFASAYFFWDPAVAAIMQWLQSWQLLAASLTWMESFGLGDLRAVLAPLLVVTLATPIIVVLTLLMVSLFMTPMMVDMVSQRRFAHLERLQGAGFWSSTGWALGSTVLVLFVMLLTLPLWLVPLLGLLIPPMLWGWLTYRVFAFDALAAYATADERKMLIRIHRPWLLGMGVVCGYLGTAPSLVWVSGALWLALAPLLVPLAIWIYAFVFAFASLWFTHYLLRALDLSRQTPPRLLAKESVDLPVQPPDADPPPPHSTPPLALNPQHVIDVQARDLP